MVIRNIFLLVENGFLQNYGKFIYFRLGFRKFARQTINNHPVL